jgi:hypothetical protein
MWSGIRREKIKAVMSAGLARQGRPPKVLSTAGFARLARLATNRLFQTSLMF